MNAKTILAAALAAFSAAGCDRDAHPMAVGPAAPATRPVAVAVPATFPATEPSAAADATTQPSVPHQATAQQPAVEEASLIVGTQQVWFPPALLRLTPADGRLTARLTSDDPPTAIEENYHGNSFDLDMALDVSDASEIGQAVWVYKSVSSEQQDDSPHGVFLDGQRRRLHPQDVVAQFQRQGPKVAVTVRGWFLLYDTDHGDRPFALPQRVFVQGRLLAAVPEK